VLRPAALVYHAMPCRHTNLHRKGRNKHPDTGCRGHQVDVSTSASDCGLRVPSCGAVFQRSLPYQSSSQILLTKTGCGSGAESKCSTVCDPRQGTAPQFPADRRVASSLVPHRRTRFEIWQKETIPHSPSPTIGANLYLALAPRWYPVSIAITGRLCRVRGSVGTRGTSACFIPICTRVPSLSWGLWVLVRFAVYNSKRTVPTYPEVMRKIPRRRRRFPALCPGGARIHFCKRTWLAPAASQFSSGQYLCRSA
jgi:hypothetical protein